MLHTSQLFTCLCTRRWLIQESLSQSSRLMGVFTWYFCILLEFLTQFILNKYSHPCFLWITICIVSISILSLSACVSLNLKWVSCRQNIVGSFFFLKFIQSLCLLIGKFNLFVSKVIIDREGVTIVILFIVFCLLSSFFGPFFSLLLSSFVFH